ncbi:CHAD domain-containing protein [Vibrio fluvialis]|nr:CHAD domain-containing protein [Vibrio fluvialis]
MREFSPLTLSNPITQLNNEPGTPAFWLFSQYLVNEFQLAQLYEPGVLRDQESEYLHQYRVSLRRCRSLLSIMAGLYQSKPVSLLLQQFKTLMEPTGKVRDLDVFINPQSHDAAIFAKLTPLLPFVQTERAQAFELLTLWLKGKEYRELKQATYASLLDCAQHPSDMGFGDIAEFAQTQWNEHHKRLLKRIDKVDAHSSDEAIHNVRIAGKKVRYLADFGLAFKLNTRSGLSLKKLKQLQTELGEFNDTASQIVFCRDHLAPLQYEVQTSGAIAEFIEHTLERHKQNKQRILHSLHKLHRRK